MSNYSISEICKLLDVKAYVIRYWEQEIALLSPKKGINGRRVFTDSDLALLFRIKHLLYDKKYTIEGANKRLWDEINNPQVDIKIKISQIRRELLDTLSSLHQSRKADKSKS